MAFFDLFWGSRPRCAPNPCRKRVVCSVELLESRLVPSAVSSSYPVGPVAVPPAATPNQVNTTVGALTQNAVVVLSGSTGGLTGAAHGQGPLLAAPALISGGPGPNLPGLSAAAPVAGGDYAVTWSSDAQDGNIWNVYTPPPGAPGGAQGGALPVNTATAPGQTGAAAAGAGANFGITWSI
jgi:hypothetical protein